MGNDNPNDRSLFLYSTNNSEVISAINSIKNGCSLGKSDMLNSELLKYVAYEISNILTYLINKSFTEGIFPESLKEAMIIPIYKAGGKTDISNYRPISILNVLSKVYEKIMKKRLLGFFYKFNILSNSQYGFRQGCSTTHAVIDCIHQIENDKDKALIPVAILLDLKKSI